MPTFIAGATGATGRHLAEQLLMRSDAVWQRWKGRMPVLYNTENPVDMGPA